jgi:hypothetical protein
VRLSDVVATAVADAKAPAAALALVYAERIDESNHVTTALAKALRFVEAAVATAVESDPLAYAGAHDAFDKVAAALSAVTVASDLGPKLLAALDALLLTPKARAAVSKATGSEEVTGRGEDDLTKLRRRRAARAG